MPWLELFIPFLVVLTATSCVAIAVTFAHALDEPWGRSLLGFLASSAGVSLVSLGGIFLKAAGLTAGPPLSLIVWNLSFFMLAMTSWFALRTAHLVTGTRPSVRARVAFTVFGLASYAVILTLALTAKTDLYFPYLGGVYAATALYLTVCLGSALGIVWRRRAYLTDDNRRTLDRFIRVFLPLGTAFLLDEILRTLAVPLPWIPLLPLAPLALYAFVTVEIALRVRTSLGHTETDFADLADAMASECHASPLTRREREILAQLLAGKSNAVIAQTLAIVPSTVKNHTYNLFQKMGVGSRSELLKSASQFRLAARRGPSALP